MCESAFIPLFHTTDKPFVSSGRSDKPIAAFSSVTLAVGHWGTLQGKNGESRGGGVATGCTVTRPSVYGPGFDSFLFSESFKPALKPTWPIQWTLTALWHYSEILWCEFEQLWPSGEQIGSKWSLNVFPHMFSYHGQKKTHCIKINGKSVETGNRGKTRAETFVLPLCGHPRHSVIKRCV